MLQGKKIVLGISGSIAAYKACYLVRALVRRGAEVQVVLTPNAKEFVTPVTLSALSGKPVVTEFFNQKDGTWHSHVEMGIWADAMIVAPATASTLGKMANGVADNILVTTYLSMKAPVFIAPAMDLDMYAHPSTQKNLDTLRSYGCQIIEPGTGFLASGLEGKGRMEDPETIAEIVDGFFAQSDSMSGKRILITAGPTYEKLDPVRFIGNYSSGKMGFALAEECANRGAEVEMICGPVSLETKNPHIHRTNVESAAEMYEAATNTFERCDAAILCAAVADFTPENVAENKVKREGNQLVLKLNPTQDIAQALGKKKRKDQQLAGFALETCNEREHAREKMKRKNFDFIVLNSLKDEGAGFQHDTNKITIIDSESETEFPLKSKKEVAKDIIDRLKFFCLCLLFMCPFLGGQKAIAQELNATVVVNHKKVNNTEEDVFKSLEKKVTNFLNETKWTELKYKDSERIQCSFNITVNTYSNTDNSFTCNLLLNCSRPVFGTSYMTTEYAIKDAQFNFEFQEADRLDFRPEQIDNQLVALLSYYAYLLIGWDLDTMSLKGGTSFLQTAEQIVTAGDALGYPGWKAFDDSKNRFGILNDYLDGAMECFRELQYKYHRQGLDKMYEDPEAGRKAISEALELLDKSRTAKNMTSLPQLFSEYKREELIKLYTGKGEPEEKNRVYEILVATDVSQKARWEKIKN